MIDPLVSPVFQSIDRRRFLHLLGEAAAFSLCSCEWRSRKFAPAEGATSADRAVNAARRFAGTSLNVGWEIGPQAQGISNFAAPLWEKLTGIQINIVELGWPIDQFRRVAAEHRAGTRALDCASIAPSWLPDLVEDRVLEPLDNYVSHYCLRQDLEDYLLLYRTMGLFGGRRYGFFDDGDTLLLYYRKDLFDDAATQERFNAKFGRPLGDPRTYSWKQFIDVARFFTDGFSSDLYGLAPLSRELLWACFECRLRVEGGQFFEPDSMKSGLDSEAGLRALTQVTDMIQVAVPMGAMEPLLQTSFASFLAGKTAMAISWPPLGRLAEYDGPLTKAFASQPRSQIVGKVGYALLPDGVSQLAVGFVLSVLANSQNKEAAYLLIQWLNSPEISLQRVERLDTLRDPFRSSHIESTDYRKRWPTAGDYLDTLRKAASGAALTELMIPSMHEYQEAFYEALTAIRFGTSIEDALKQLSKAWDQITEGRGRNRQRTAYKEFLKVPGAVMPNRTPPAAGTIIY